MRTSRLIAIVLVATLVLSGCDIFTSKKEKLPGQRISVLELEKQLEPDPALASLQVTLPRPEADRDWPQSGGVPTHYMGHPLLSNDLKVAWRQSVGQGHSDTAEMLAAPVVEDGVVYTMDAVSLVSAWRATDGTKIWQTDITPADSENPAWGGGIGYDSGHIYVADGFAEVLSLDARTGNVEWRVSTGSPVHGAPTIANDHVFIITIDNEIQALSTKDGHKDWSYDGIPESAVIAGTGSPVVSGRVVVAPFSSGEIVALSITNGEMVWNDTLAATKRFDPMSTLADIRGRPVVYDGKVYAISHSGRMTAIDLRTGARIWEQDIGGAYEPWVAGDFVYVLSTSAQLVCLTRDDGRIRWLTQLDQYEDPEDKSGPIQWAGPLLAGDRLVVMASTGEAWSVSPYTGKPLGRLELPAASYLSPIAVDGTLYLMTDDADLMALR